MSAQILYQKKLVVIGNTTMPVTDSKEDQVEKFLV